MVHSVSTAPFGPLLPLLPSSPLFPSHPLLVVAALVFLVFVVRFAALALLILHRKSIASSSLVGLKNIQPNPLRAFAAFPGFQVSAIRKVSN